MTRNQIEYWKNVEQQRSNRVAEAETAKHNRAMERLKSDEINASKRGQDIQARNTQLSNQTTLEASRINATNQMRQLAETSRANLARETQSRAELNSLNSDRVRQASQRDYVNSTNRQNVIEGARHNRQNELLGLRQYDETVRSNRARETENTRSNQAQESLRSRDLDIQHAKYAEQLRSNLANESNVRRGQNFQLLGSIASSVSRVIPGKLKGVSK